MINGVDGSGRVNLSLIELSADGAVGRFADRFERVMLVSGR